MADGSAIIDKPKHAGGRPTDYQPEFCDTIIELGKQGYSRARMAAHIGVAKSTITEWSQKIPEFSNALTRAMTFAQAHLEGKGYENLGERNFNTPLYIGMMKSMFREDYTDRTVNEIVGKDDGPIETKELGTDARAVAFMLGRAIGRQEKANAEKSDS